MENINPKRIVPIFASQLADTYGGTGLKRHQAKQKRPPY